MDLKLDRPDYTPEDKMGPNTEPFAIEPTRVVDSKVNMNLSTFRSVVTTRFDRMDAEPNTRLEYERKAAALGGLLEMSRMQGRNAELFPVVDMIIRKAGDEEMKKELKKCIPVKEINEAHRPKNVENYALMLREREF